MAVAYQDMEIMEEEGPEEDTNSGEESHKNPWPNLEDLNAFKRKKGNNIIMQCKMCLPRRTELSAYKTSTSNLRKHVGVCAFVSYIPNGLFIGCLKKKDKNLTM